MSIDFRGRERNGGSGQVNQAKGASAEAQQARWPRTAARQALPGARERERERERERQIFFFLECGTYLDERPRVTPIQNFWQV